MKFSGVLCLLAVLAIPSLAIDREAFTFTRYDLDVRVEPELQRLAVRGKLTLRNDSPSPQESIALQISSSLDWRSIRLGGKPVQFVSHEYTSDIDHTGALSEAVVTLPQEIPSQGAIDLEVGYEGVIPLDTTRLSGVPQDKAKRSDWDQISKTFTAVRGIGYVAWYPVATGAAMLSEGNSVEEEVGRWKLREANTAMSFRFETTADAPVLFSGSAVKGKYNAFNTAPGINAPTFVIAGYQKLAVNNLLSVLYLPGQEDAAKSYGEIAAKLDSLGPAGGGSGNLQILGLPEPEWSSFVTEGMLLSSMKSPIANDAVLNIVYAKAHQSIVSPRPWIEDGLAHYAQAAFIGKQEGRLVALDYLKAHQPILVEAEKSARDKTGSEATRSLINSPDDLYLQTKAMHVWWMLADMLGHRVDSFLLGYRAGEDKDAAYVQRLIEKETHRDLQWFFDDWVYRDRGLPDFRIESVYSRPLAGGGLMVTVAVENLGNAGAEVPVILRTESGDITRRLEVRAKSKVSIRIESSSTPSEAVVNDGSVPETDISNNAFKVPPEKELVRGSYD